MEFQDIDQNNNDDNSVESLKFKNYLKYIFKANKQLNYYLQPQALRCFLDALKYKRDDYKVQVGMSMAYQELDQFRDAIDACDKCIHLNPMCVTAYINRGFSLYALKKQSEALINYDAAISLDTSRHILIFRKAETLQHLGMYEESMHTCEKYLNLVPESNDAILFKNMINQRMNILNEA